MTSRSSRGRLFVRRPNGSDLYPVVEGRVVGFIVLAIFRRSFHAVDLGYLNPFDTAPLR